MKPFFHFVKTVIFWAIVFAGLIVIFNFKNFMQIGKWEYETNYVTRDSVSVRWQCNLTKDSTINYYRK